MSLNAVGRAPNADLNLAAAGVATDTRRFIQVNARLETNIPGIWALRDIIGCSLLCHAAGEVISTVQMVMQASCPTRFCAMAC